MASIKNLKKDVDAVIFELVSDCYTYKYLFPEKEQGDVDKLITNSLELRNNLFTKINNPPQEDKKAVKKHYRGVFVELFKGVDEGFNKLSELAK